MGKSKEHVELKETLIQPEFLYRAIARANRIPKA